MLSIQQQQPMPGVVMPGNQICIQPPQMVTQQFPQQQVPMSYPQASYPMQYTTANPAQIVPIVMQQPTHVDQSMILIHDNSHLALNNSQNDLVFQKNRKIQSVPNSQPVKQKEYHERPDISICAGIRSCCTRTLRKVSDCLHFIGNFVHS